MVKEENIYNGRPGLLVLFGSGETLPSSGKAHEFVAKKIQDKPRIAILETPAGFQPNSARVARDVGDFLERRLQNYQPEISIIPARKKDSQFSTDNQILLKSMLEANWIFMGPGSPTYAVRQLDQSLAYQFLIAKHRLGTPITLASAAILAMSSFTLPVYEIYKVGEDLHWQAGLNFLWNYGLEIVFIPHWNNNDGGEELDTSHCYMGVDRFNRMLEIIPKKQAMVGIDEHTALILDFEEDCCRVFGQGSVRVLVDGTETVYQNDEKFPLQSLGNYQIPPEAELVPAELREMISSLADDAFQNGEEKPPLEVINLVDARESARERKDWMLADELREQVQRAGWLIQDTPEGPILNKLIE